MYKIMNRKDVNNVDISEYVEIYTANMVTDEEILEIFKEFSQIYPNELFAALENPDSFLLKLCRLIRTDFSESICVIARTMLESNINSLLEYINNRQHSKTLKYLIKDIEGMAYLKENILRSLTSSVGSVRAVKEMLHKTISLHISLSKIDFTLVLLTPVMEYIKSNLTEKLQHFGSDLAAELLFNIISQRSCELIKSTEEIGKGNDKIKSQGQGDILEFLLSLLPYDSMIHTLALSISRDCILARSNRNELIALLENKLGFYRTSSIGIIKKDFEYFSAVEMPKDQIYTDVVGATCIPKEVFSGQNINVDHFIVSEHYWPDSNYQCWDDLLSTPSAGNVQKTETVNSQLHNQITLEYTSKHTYLHITVEVNGRAIDLSVPIRYVEYLYSSEGMTQNEVAVIREFWEHIEKQTLPKCN